MFILCTSYLGIVNLYDLKFDLKINLGHYFIVQWFGLTPWILFNVWTSLFGIMNQYDQTFDLKVNVGHCDLYFMMYWFCVSCWGLGGGGGGGVGWWSSGTKVSCISHHRGVQLILAYTWARPAILVAGKGRGVMFLFLLFLHFHSCSSFFSVPLFHLYYYLFSLFLWETTQNDPQGLLCC